MKRHLLKVMSKLSVAAIQPDLLWLNSEANLSHLSKQISSLPKTVDIIVLPEIFTSGFTQIPESVSGDQHTLEWMLAHAKMHQCALAGSVAYELDNVDDSPGFVNLFLFVMPDGQYHHYDKWHLFRMAGEHQRYRAGRQRCVIDYRDWRRF